MTLPRGRECHKKVKFGGEIQANSTTFSFLYFVQISAQLSFRAQDVFKQALQTNRIQLRIIRAEAPPLPKQPPPLLPRAEKQNPRNLNLSKNSVPSPIKLEDLMPPKQVYQLVESVPSVF